MEQKLQQSDMVACVRKHLNTTLDSVLIPLKKSEPSKFKALMAEQATWNRSLEPSCQVEEELSWIDFDEGTRSDGTARGYAYMQCLDVALTERVLYARSLAANDATALAKHINEVQKRGASVKSFLEERHARAAQRIMLPQKPPSAEDGGMVPEWKAFYDDVASIKKNTLDLAHTTCTNWPELATALGGNAACEKKTELYYYLQGNAPPEDTKD